MGEGGNDLFGNSIAEILLLGVARHIIKRQDGDRRASMHGRRQGPEQVSTGFVFTALVLGLILMPFIKCGQAIGCVSEDFGETKALVTDEEEERPRISTTLAIYRVGNPVPGGIRR